MGNRLRTSPTGELQHGVQQSQYGGHYAHFNKESHDGVHSFSLSEFLHVRDEAATKLW